MLCSLDTVIVISAVKGNPADQFREVNHLDVLQRRSQLSEQRANANGMSGSGVWSGARAAPVGLFPLLSRVEPAHGQFHNGDAYPRQCDSRQPSLPGTNIRTTKALRPG